MGKLKIQTIHDSHEVVSVHGMMIGEWIPITISNVKVTCYNDCIVQVDNILVEEMKSSLIAIRVDVDHKAGVAIAMECQNVDISMVNNIGSQHESHFCETSIDICNNSSIVVLIVVIAYKEYPIRMTGGAI